MNEFFASQNIDQTDETFEALKKFDQVITRSKTAEQRTLKRVSISSVAVVATKLTISVLAVVNSNIAILITLPFDIFIGGSIFMAALLIKSSISKIPDLKTKN